MEPHPLTSAERRQLRGADPGPVWSGSRGRRGGSGDRAAPRGGSTGRAELLTDRIATSATDAAGDQPHSQPAHDHAAPSAAVAPCPALAFAGGGTGGHVVPGLHVLAHLENASRAPRDLLWFGAGREIEERALKRSSALLERIPFEHSVLSLEPPGGGAPSLARVAAKTVPAFRAARRAMKRHGSKVLLGLGGYTMVPAILAARSLGLPVLLLEINAASGRATRALSPLATRVYHAWPSTLPAASRRGSGAGRHVALGPPLAPAFLAGAPDAQDSARERERLGFDPERPLLAVLGGSQGARALNNYLTQWAPKLVGSGLQVLHQVGPGRRSEGCEPFLGYRAVEYVDDMVGLLRAATLVLCRGGASTLAEVAALGRPAWVVPYPHHPDQHQAANARSLGDGVRIKREDELSASLAEELLRAASHEGADARLSMTRTLVRAVPSDAGERLAEELVRFATRAR